MGATVGADLERAATLAARLEAAEATLGSRQAGACQGPAVLAYFGGDLDAVSLHAQEWIGRAPEANDPYELGHALILHAAVLQVTDPEQSVTTAEEAVRIGRDAGITSVLSIGLAALAGFLPIESLEDAPRALALLDEAIEVGTIIGDRQAVSAAIMTKASVPIRLGQWTTGFDAAVDAAELQLQLGALNSLPGAYMGAAISLVHLGRLEPAAVLAGAADARGDRSTWGEWSRELATEVDVALLAGLGEERLTALRDRGAGLENAGLVAYLRVEADHALTDQSG